MKPKQDMRINVRSPDETEDWGQGTVIEVADLVDDDSGEVFSHDFPIIKLDDGREITGLDCWWSPMQEELPMKPAGMTTTIAITGVQGAGKSYFCEKLMKTIMARHRSVCLVSEVTKNCPYPINENATSATQDWLWHEQIRKEITNSNPGVEYIIYDRSAMDHLCYLKHIMDKKHNQFQKHLEDKFEMLYAITKEWAKGYTYVVRLPLDLERLQSDNNPLRSKDIVFAKEIDLIFDELVDPFVNITEDELWTMLNKES